MVLKEGIDRRTDNLACLHFDIKRKDVSELNTAPSILRRARTYNRGMSLKMHSRIFDP